MNIYPTGIFTGKYEASSSEDIAKVDYVSAHEFAAHGNGIGPINIALAHEISERFTHLPILASYSIACALKEINPKIKPVAVYHGGTANTTASHGGTWSELQKAKVTMGSDKSMLVIGHAHHAPRIAAQAEEMGLPAFLPDGLPTNFDKTSSQWWCRNPVTWAIRETFGVPILRIKGQL